MSNQPDILPDINQDIHNADKQNPNKSQNSDEDD
jgi:hypothetical protein